MNISFHQFSLVTDQKFRQIFILLSETFVLDPFMNEQQRDEEVSSGS